MPLDTTAPAESGGEQPKRITEKQFLRAWRELLTNRQDIDEAKENASSVRGVRSGIIKRVEGFGYSKKALKIFETLVALDEDERMRVIEDISFAARVTKTQMWREGDNARPQGVLFRDMAEEGTATDPELQREQQEVNDTVIRTDAWNTAKVGGEASANPYKVGTRDHQTWAQEWNRYQREHDGNGAQQAAARKKRASSAAKPNGADRSESAKKAAATRKAKKGEASEDRADA